MDRETTVKRILQSFLPENPLTRKRGNPRDGLKTLRTGTTIVGFKFKNGVLLAADRRTMWGSKIVSHDTVKVESVSRVTGIGCAGLVSDGQYIKNLLGQVNRSFRLRAGVPLTIRGQANYVASLLHEAYSYGFPFELEMIICGFNFFGSFEIFEILEDGCLADKDFTVVGSGTWDALHVLEERKRSIANSSLVLEDAVSLAVDAIYNSGEHDSGTSPVTATLPSVAIVTSGGFDYVEEKVIQSARRQVLKRRKKNG